MLILLLSYDKSTILQRSEIPRQRANLMFGSIAEGGSLVYVCVGSDVVSCCGDDGLTRHGDGLL